MERRHQTQKGRALIELVLVLPVLLLLLLGVAEVGNALNAYLTVLDASREGARLVVRDGPSAGIDVPNLVLTLTNRFPSNRVSTNVSIDNDSVTVEVTYDYQFVFNSMPFVQQRILPSPFNIRANTIMPLP